MSKKPKNKYYVNPVTNDEFRCDVHEKGKRCEGHVALTWNVLMSYKRVCSYHWERHSDDNDSFNLFDAFGQPRPCKSMAGMPKPPELEAEIEYKIDEYGDLVPVNPPPKTNKKDRPKSTHLRKVSKAYQSKAPRDLKRDAVALSILGDLGL